MEYNVTKEKNNYFGKNGPDEYSRSIKREKKQKRKKIYSVDGYCEVSQLLEEV